MSLQAITHLNVDFHDNKYTLINAKQYDDSSRWIYVTCYNRGEIFNIKASEHSAYVRYRKADGHGVLNFCRINYKGEILVELTEQMLASDGICYVDLIIINKGKAVINVDTGEIITIDESPILSTMAFCINAQEATVDNSIIESSYEFNALNEALKKSEANYTEIIRLSKSYAMGDANNIRENENKDNSKYYYELSLKSANNSATSEANALASENKAKESELKAKESEEKSLVSEQNAKTSEMNAFESASNALTSETNALNSANNSENSAKNSADSATSSLNSANDSKASADASALSAEAAAKSEECLYDSELKAKESEEKAKLSEEKALESANSALTSANNASTSEQNALESANNSATSATNAESFANEAGISASNASTSESNALSSANNAELSADSASGSENNARTYYLQAEEIVSGLDGVFKPMGTIMYSELAEIKDSGLVEAGYLYNISDGFITDDTFKKGEGLEYESGTSVYYTSDGYWDCLTGTALTINIATVDEVKNYLSI